ncbi:MAG: nucleoside hydrolase [Paracoccaceae bacterium]|nr:nucleoside hydrolase [Paracoccaceae bacterium]MDE2913974.1 nucleoside hydrolase [Paracoccaceae bacterium]
MPGARKIIIDTDPGQDDAVAILAAFASPELDVLAITAVAGNVGLHHTERNARAICELAGRRDMRVFAGCDRPTRRPLMEARHVHGETGLDGPDLPPPTMPLQPEHAVDVIIEILRTEPSGSVTLAALGPLTNIATALGRAPDIASRIAEIVFMGGAYFELGNVTPVAEFNIYVDPDAAADVFACGAKITSMPLDVTHRALATPERVSAFQAAGNPAGAAISQLTAFRDRQDPERYGGIGVPLHDPCVIAYLLEPDLFAGRFVNLEVETGSELTRGMTVADWWRRTDRQPNATFMREIDAEGYFRLLAERIARL